jgi:hypothetical protein
MADEEDMASRSYCKELISLGAVALTAEKVSGELSTSLDVRGDVALTRFRVGGPPRVEGSLGGSSISNRRLSASLSAFRRRTL